MESLEGTAKERRALQRVSHSGLALLPWTKQILTVLWENFCLLLQVICYSLTSVFQMFRFEVHLRITDDAGEHIQQLKNATDEPTDGFLLSTLFKSKKNVVVAGPSPLSKFNKDPFDISSHSKSVLSSLVSDNICCSLVDDFMCHVDKEQYGWKHSFDWNFHTGSESRCKDVVSFTECVSIYNVNEIQTQADPSSVIKHNLSSLKISGHSSDSDLSWGSSDGSCVDGERPDNDGLWDILTRSNDPYHPLHFTACLSSAVSNQQSNNCMSSHSGECSYSDSSEQGNTDPMNLEDDEEVLWKSLSRDDDPYHPLNFRAPLKSSVCISDRAKGLPEQSLKKSKDSTVARCMKPSLMPKRVISHRCPQLCVEKPNTVPWRRPITKSASTKQEIPTIKRVKFSPVVQVHKMRAWSFALQACRKGPWEEYARDRNRFQRRILETEQAIGYCFSLLHRNKFSA